MRDSMATTKGTNHTKTEPYRTMKAKWKRKEGVAAKRRRRRNRKKVEGLRSLI